MTARLTNTLPKTGFCYQHPAVVEYDCGAVSTSADTTTIIRPPFALDEGYALDLVIDVTTDFTGDGIFEIGDSVDLDKFARLDTGSGPTAAAGHVNSRSIGLMTYQGTANYGVLPWNFNAASGESSFVNEAYLTATFDENISAGAGTLTAILALF